MATLRVTPIQPESLWCLKMDGPVYRGEMEPPTPTTPSTKLQQLHEETRQHTYKRNAANSESDTINSSARPRQYGTLDLAAMPKALQITNGTCKRNDTGCQAC